MRVKRMLAAAALGLALASPARANQAKEDVSKHPGYVDFAALNVFGPEEAEVEVFLEQNLINMVAAVTAGSDPELSKMLGKLKLIRVQTFSIDETKIEIIEKKTEEMAKRLESKGWMPVVKVRERKKGSQTYVMFKYQGSIISGLTVMNVDPTDEAAFVNIVGEIDPDQIGKIGRKFDIHSLDSLETEWKHKGSKRSKGKD